MLHKAHSNNILGSIYLLLVNLTIVKLEQKMLLMIKFIFISRAKPEESESKNNVRND